MTNIRRFKPSIESRSGRPGLQVMRDNAVLAGGSFEFLDFIASRFVTSHGMRRMTGDDCLDLMVDHYRFNGGADYVDPAE